MGPMVMLPVILPVRLCREPAWWVVTQRSLRRGGEGGQPRREGSQGGQAGDTDGGPRSLSRVFPQKHPPNPPALLRVTRDLGSLSLGRIDLEKHVCGCFSL